MPCLGPPPQEHYITIEPPWPQINAICQLGAAILLIITTTKLTSTINTLSAHPLYDAPVSEVVFLFTFTCSHMADAFFTSEVKKKQEGEKKAQSGRRHSKCHENEAFVYVPT